MVLMATRRDPVDTVNKKGLLELCVLSLLSRHDSRGYDISDFTTRLIPVMHGEVYPALRRLKNEGLLKTYTQDESGGKPGKYYSLTQLGREAYMEKMDKYLTLVKAIKQILEGSENDKN